MSLNQWGSELGKRVLGKLSLLYTYLVWESSVLLTLCTPNLTDDEQIGFARDDLSKLIPKDLKGEDTTKVFEETRAYLFLSILL